MGREVLEMQVPVYRPQKLFPAWRARWTYLRCDRGPGREAVPVEEVIPEGRRPTETEADISETRLGGQDGGPVEKVHHGL